MTTQPPQSIRPPRLNARLAATTSEVGRLAALAVNPQTRTAIVGAKIELQRLAVEGLTATPDEMELIMASLDGIETTLQAVSRAIDAGGREALLTAILTPAGLAPPPAGAFPSTPTPSR